MSYVVSEEKLGQVAELVSAEDEALLGSAPIIGKFDEARWPDLVFSTFSVNQVRTAVSPECSFRLLRDALSTAQSELLIYIYDFTDPDLIDLVKDALAQGVKVRLMYDATSTPGSELAKMDSLASAGADVKPAPSSGRRLVFTVCHQKFAVIDGKTLFLGSGNWGVTGFPKLTQSGTYKKGNREWLIRVDDAALAAWFKTLFQKDWNIVEMEAPGGLLLDSEAVVLGPMFAPAHLLSPPEHVFDTETFNLAEPAQVTPILSPNNYFDLCKNAFESATKSIRMQQQYIKAAGPKIKELVRCIADARERGVEVRIMVSQTFLPAWKASVLSLEAFQLEDCLKAQNPRLITHLHNKGIVVDEEVVIVTSTNWSENSVTLAREGGVLVRSKDVAAYFARVFDFDWSEGEIVGSVPQRLVELAGEAVLNRDGFIEIPAADLA